MLTFGNSKIAITGFDALFVCTAIVAVQLSYFGNLIAGIGLIVLFAQFRSVWSKRASRPGKQGKWRKALNVNLTANDYLLIFIGIVVLQLIFTSQVIAEVSPDAGKGAAVGLDKAWQALFLGDRGIPSFFGVLCNALRGVGIIALVFQSGYALVKMVSNDGEPSVKEFARTQLIERVIPNVIVIMLLAQNGAGGANIVLTARTFIFSVDKIAYTAMKEAADSIKQYTLAEEERKVLEEIRSVFNTCISIPAKVGGESNPTFAECITEFSKRAGAAQAGGQIKNQATKDQIKKLIDELAKLGAADATYNVGQIMATAGAILSSAIGASLKTGTDELINAWVASIGVAYNFAVELALMMMGISLPLVLTLSLYKFETFMKWCPQILILFVSKITYTIVVGVVQYLKADAGADLGVFGLALLTGIFSPLVSVYVGLALNGSLGSVFEREAFRAAAGVVGAAATVAGAGAIGSIVAGPVASAANTSEVIAKRV
jgi:hypothetical protein